MAILFGALYLAAAGNAVAAPKTLYTFTGMADGSVPVAPLATVGELLFGVNSVGGANGTGTIFEFNPSTNALTTMFNLPAGFTNRGGVTMGTLAYLNNA